MNFDFNSYLNFETFITRSLIKWVYIVIAIIITLGALFAMVYESFVVGVAALFIGNIMWRIWCELMILAFSIQTHLKNIDNKTNYAGENEHEHN